uniref:Protein ARV n=1 Tax=Noccaea caerulescens TaxID=107243 RepID=A0A1J3H330_NOCCA
MASEYRCVGCGFRVKSLFIQYTPRNIRLMKCGNCKEVADEYIECERMIIFIDLILHRPKVYRHVLYNAINPEIVNIQHLLWKLVLGYLLLDSYRSLLLRRSDDESSFSENSVLISVKVLIGVISANVAFIISFAIAAKCLLNEVSRRREILLGILISSYFKIFLLAMLVWKFPISVIFIIDILVLTSNSMALKVMTESTTSRCIAVCLVAHSVRFLVGHIFEPTTFFTQFGSLLHPSPFFRIL